MHLTRFEIHRGRRSAQKLLGSPQAMHAAVCLAFPRPIPSNDQDPLYLTRSPGNSARVEHRVLWRVDDDGRETLLYLVSAEPPDLTHLVEQAGWPTQPDGWATRSYYPFLERLAPGQRWAFRLAANPTHAVRLPGRRRSQRLGHVTMEQQAVWLLDRAQAHGFNIMKAADHDKTGSEPALTVHHRQVREFRRRDLQNGRNGQVTITTAVYDGVLEVQDAELLRHALTHGIGPAKAYGCGLLTLGRPR